MLLKIKKLHSSACPPSYVHPGDAGMDLFALERVVLKSGERTAIKTGIAMEIPKGYVGLIWDKSGLSIREGLKTLGGVVDAGYRGEILVGMINFGDKSYTFEAGHKVAQMLIQKVEQPTIRGVKGLTKTNRNKGGFGSTGV